MFDADNQHSQSPSELATDSTDRYQTTVLETVSRALRLSKRDIASHPQVDAFRSPNIPRPT